MSKENKNIILSEKTVQRILIYKSILEELSRQNIKYVHSYELEKFTHFKQDLIRRDIMFLNFKGSTSKGYEVKELLRRIFDVLKLNRKIYVGIIGAGKASSFNLIMKTKQQTHLLTSQRLVGEVISIEKGKAEVVLKPVKEMMVDEYGLIHGGFVFGLADYAAMLVVNEPNVVLGKAEVKFLKPVKSNEKIVAKAKLNKSEQKKHIVDVDVYNEQNEIVFKGSFVCFVTDEHVLQMHNNNKQ